MPSNQSIKKPIPITIITGFLGAGKSTILNKIINENKNLKFGLIINEFGEIGIDGEIIESSGQEMVELSNGCMCCIVRSDLYSTVEKLITETEIDYILIEASGLAEPKPIADTFLMNDLDGRVSLEGVICLVDLDSFSIAKENYQVATDQLQFCDILVLNKYTQKQNEYKTDFMGKLKKLNPGVAVLENINNEIDSKQLIDTGAWDIERLESYKEKEEQKEKTKKHEHEHHKQDDHNHNHTKHNEDHGHHNHEHETVDEVVFISEKNMQLDPNKLDIWMTSNFPKNCIRAKGILKLKIGENSGSDMFLFQMVGASKMLIPFIPVRKNCDLSYSRLVLIGKNLDKNKILTDLKNCLA